MDDQAVTKLDSLARQVADQHATMEAAFDEERDAEAAFLEKVVASVRPALRALSCALVATDRHFWVSSVETDREKTYHTERGVIVAGDGPERDHPTANDGAIVGTSLVLLDDGSFARLDWSGGWTRWQGRASETRSTLTRLSLREVVDTWDAEEVAAALAERLDGQLSGKATKTTAASRARAEKLRAVSALLGGRS